MIINLLVQVISRFKRKKISRYHPLELLALIFSFAMPVADVFGAQNANICDSRFGVLCVVIDKSSDTLRLSELKEKKLMWQILDAKEENPSLEAPSSFYQIQSRQSLKFITMQDNSDPFHLEMSDEPHPSRSQWQFVNGFIRNKHSNLCLNRLDSEQLELSLCKNDDSMKWTIYTEDSDEKRTKKTRKLKVQLRNSTDRQDRMDRPDRMSETSFGQSEWVLDPQENGSNKILLSQSKKCLTVAHSEEKQYGKIAHDIYPYFCTSISGQEFFFSFYRGATKIRVKSHPNRCIGQNKKKLALVNCQHKTAKWLVIRKVPGEIYQPKVVTYPKIDFMPLNGESRQGFPYRVEVSVKGKDDFHRSYLNVTKPNPDYRASTSSSGSHHNYGADHFVANNRKFFYTTFSFHGPITVRVKRLDQPFIDLSKISLKPERYNLEIRKVDDRTIEFDLYQSGKKIWVDFGDARFTHEGWEHYVRQPLMIFADPLEKPQMVVEPDQPNTRVIEPGHGIPQEIQEEFIYFSPGVHDIGVWVIPKHIRKIYIPGGGLVKGSLVWLGGKNHPQQFGVQILGRGILSGMGFRWRENKNTGSFEEDSHRCHAECVKMLEFFAGHNLVEGITIADQSYHMVFNVASAPTDYINFKQIGAWYTETDGIELYQGGNIVDSFMQNYDDGLKIYHSNSRVENLVFWKFGNGGLIQMGWATRQIENVLVRNIDSLQTEWNWTDYGGTGYTNGLINFHWSPTWDFCGESYQGHFNDPYYLDGVLYAYNQQGAHWQRRAYKRGRINNILFDDIRAEGKVLRAFGLVACPNQQIGNITFRNIDVKEGLAKDRRGKQGNNILKAYDYGHIHRLNFENIRFGDLHLNASNWTNWYGGKFDIKEESIKHDRSGWVEFDTFSFK